MNILNLFPGTARPQQEYVLKELEEKWNTHDVFVVQAPVACHGDDVNVLMFDGSTKSVTDIQVGDRLMGPDSTPRTVLETYTGIAPMRLIVPLRGKPWTATFNHILSLQEWTRTQTANTRTACLRHRLISVSDYETASKNIRKNSRLWRTGVEFAETKQPLDAYILGLWLGDGTSKAVALTTQDSDICEIWEQYGTEFELKAVRRQKPDSKAWTSCLVRQSSKHPNNMLEILKSLGVYNNKHIPRSYLIASRTQRLSLLAGLMDTDGYFTSTGSAEITQKRKELAEQILFLIQSLGFYTKLTPCIKADQNKTKGQYYRVTFSGPLAEIPIRCKRKRPPVSSYSDQNRTTFTTKDLGVQRYYGFSLDKDQLYLLDDFTVTHNTGKSRLAYTLAKFAGQGAILTPNNLLVQQYQRDFPELPVLNKKDTYKCERDKRSCSTTIKKCGKPCDNCPMVKAKKDFYDAPIYVANYYTYLAHKQWRDTLIVDEAHNLLKMLTDDAAQRVWKHKDHYPATVQTYADVVAWLETRGTTYKKLLATLKRDKERSLLQRAWEYYRGDVKECLKMVPIDAREQPPILWNPHKVKKIVLLSATINHNDIYDLGLDRRRVCYLSVDSPIDAWRRPVVYSPVGKVSYQTQTQIVPRLVERIISYAERHATQKGLIHTTYSLSSQLQQQLHASRPDLLKRFIFYTKQSKQSAYKEYLTRTDPCILVACGMTEGIDLPGDLGRWQVVTKVPFLSLGDPAIDHKRRAKPEWYAWQAVLGIIQASGRICRGPLDRGTTYIIDENFGGILRQYPRLFPKWFMDAYKTEA